MSYAVSGTPDTGELKNEPNLSKCIYIQKYHKSSIDKNVLVDLKERCKTLCFSMKLAYVMSLDSLTH